MTSAVTGLLKRSDKLSRSSSDLLQRCGVSS